MGRREITGGLLLTVIAGGMGSLIGATALQTGSPYFDVLLYAGIVAIAFGALGLILMALLPNKPVAPPLPTVDQRVTSHGQTGGITAHTVYAAPAPRTLDSPAGEEIKAALRALPPGDAWSVGHVAGDAEAYDFAVEVWRFMVSQGFKVEDSLTTLVMNRPVEGYKIRPKDDQAKWERNRPWMVIIGTNPGKRAPN